MLPGYNFSMFQRFAGSFYVKDDVSGLFYS